MIGNVFGKETEDFICFRKIQLLNVYVCSMLLLYVVSQYAEKKGKKLYGNK